MTIEKRLENEIIARFETIAEFSRASGVKDATIRSILRRGIHKAHIDTIFPICRTLGIVPEKLFEGEIVSIYDSNRDLFTAVEMFKKNLNEKSYRIRNQFVRDEDIEEICDYLDYAMTRISKRYK